MFLIFGGMVRTVSTNTGTDITETPEIEKIVATEIDTRTNIKKGKPYDQFRSVGRIRLLISFRERDGYEQKRSYFEESEEHHEEHHEDHKGGLSNQDKDLYDLHIFL
jgi:hypothetical protein